MTLLERYLAIERVSIDMVAAAQAGNWDEIRRLEAICLELIADLRVARQQLPALDATATAAKLKIIERILINDAALAILYEATHRGLGPDKSADSRTLH